jgi:hypothetical protein
VQYLINLSIRPDADPAKVAEARTASSKALWELHLAGVIREMYARQDNQGVVFMAEAPNTEALMQAIAAIPFLKDGLLVGDAVGLAPFADLQLAFG